MNWYEAIEGLIDTDCRGRRSELRKKTGITDAHLAYYKANPDASMLGPTLERLETGLGIRFTMDRQGKPVGFERISADDIDNKTDASDIQTKSSEISEDEVYARYDAVRRRAGLPPLENLDDDTRSALRRRIVQLENEITALVSLGENDIISIVGNENTTSREK